MKLWSKTSATTTTEPRQRTPEQELAAWRRLDAEYERRKRSTSLLVEEAKRNDRAWSGQTR